MQNLNINKNEDIHYISRNIIIIVKSVFPIEMLCIMFLSQHIWLFKMTGILQTLCQIVPPATL